MKSLSLRKPAVAGTFYPGSREGLSALVHEYLEHAQPSSVVPKALIAPHAGYIYSGPVAGSAFATIDKMADRVNRVILLGPSHRVSFQGLAMSTADRFSTPLGEVPLDTEARDLVLRFPQVVELDKAHTFEHSLEVELPFLQTVLRSFLLLPLVVGDATYEEVSEVLDAVWGGEETLIVISSDLSHFLSYESACELDEKTRLAIEALQPEDLSFNQACGRIPIGGLLLSARKRGLQVTTLDMRNSGDTAGPRDEVVGYGAYAIG
ncbi:MAG: AmmeMemoRadiSam system protein B [Verrucomicrobiae bacterium]|nr:AmmeMemoRadiSam system protein B [Verrucomicrobiae bacterium]